MVKMAQRASNPMHLSGYVRPEPTVRRRCVCVCVCVCLCIGGLRWGFRVCKKVHSANAVAQDFDEGRGNICVRV